MTRRLGRLRISNFFFYNEPVLIAQLLTRARLHKSAGSPYHDEFECLMSCPDFPKIGENDPVPEYRAIFHQGSGFHHWETMDGVPL